MLRIAHTVTTAVLAVAVATAAQAQIDTPPPPLMGQPSFHLYSVPGVIRGGGLGTFFACTNTTGATIRVGVELFGPAGGGPANDASATSLDVGPSATVVFGVGSAVGVSVSGTLGGAFSKGSARILATAKKGIICGAFLADDGNAPPTSMTTLMVVARTKQHGD